MKVMTIGFTQKPAERFFELLSTNKVHTLFDVRLNNRSQLAGFAKQDDLIFFLRRLCDIKYQHLPMLAPTEAMLKAYRNKQISWAQYETVFLALMQQRQVERMLSAELLDGGCLLCSEHQPHFCHRRLVLGYLNQHWQTHFEVEHL